MFRDLKEYQEIAKIYAEKVSKPENLEERRGSSSAQLAQNRKDAFASKPNTSTYQSNRDKLNKQRTELNKGRVEKQFGFLKSKPIERKPGQTSVRSRGGGAKQTRPEPKYKPEPGVVFGQRANETGALGGGKPSSVPVEKKPAPKPEVSTMTKQGKPRTKAQMMAAKRIAAGKSISDVKAENQAAMKAKAKERFAAFKAKRAEKKAGMSEGVGAALQIAGKVAPKIPSALKALTAGAATGASILGIKKAAEEGRPAKRRKQTKTIDQVKADNEARKKKEREQAAKQRFIKKEEEAELMDKAIEFGKIDDAKNSAAAQKIEADKIKKARQAFRTGTKQESYEPYDFVLEYLLSTEQVATIEEANYVMTEMDAETIQGIVEAQKKNLEEGLPLLAKGAAIVGGAVLAKKGLDKAKKSFDNYLDNRRDKGIGGNTRPGSDKMYYGDKKKK